MKVCDKEKENVSPLVCAPKEGNVCVCVCVSERGHVLHKHSGSLIHSPISISPSLPSLLCCSLSQIESGDLPETIPDNHT